MNRRVQRAKKDQGYTSFPMTCKNCGHFASEMVKNSYGFYDEKNKRCSIGNFAITSMATCTLHVLKEVVK